ncbi:hypothetical protein RB195_005314 [Necator americanus]|uniref:Uncharacterized protein n=1 Tax=Necator americanus TaxID=51031 RepID=A0ABR1BM78_NECAM
MVGRIVNNDVLENGHTTDKAALKRHAPKAHKTINTFFFAGLKDTGGPGRKFTISPHNFSLILDKLDKFLRYDHAEVLLAILTEACCNQYKDC